MTPSVFLQALGTVLSIRKHSPAGSCSVMGEEEGALPVSLFFLSLWDEILRS
jgi:hypothetical protein